MIPPPFAHCLYPGWYMSSWKAQNRQARIFTGFVPRQRKEEGIQRLSLKGKLWEGTPGSGHREDGRAEGRTVSFSILCLGYTPREHCVSIS